MSEFAHDPSPVLVVNAGGASRRMGRPKALLPVPPEEAPLLVHVVRRLRSLVDDRVIVIANDPAIAAQVMLEPAPRFVADRYPDTGTLGGIATGLHALPAPGWALVMACDLPLVSAPLCTRLIALSRERDAACGYRWDAVVPMVDGFAEPLHALYHKCCLPFIEARLAAGERRVISFMPDVRVRYVDEAELRTVDPELHSLVNANTPEEWQRALLLLAAE